MQYMVVWSDGKKYGPATIEVLNQWVLENRVTPDTMLETLDGQPIPARDVPGIVFAGAAPAAAFVPSIDAAPLAPEAPVSPIPAFAPSTPIPHVAQPISAASYFVLGPDGSKYGPADVATLSQWAGQSRLTPTTQLQDAATGDIVMASQVPGLNFTAVAPEQPTGYPLQTPTQSGAYSQAPQYTANVANEAAKKDFTNSLILAGLGFFCCPVLMPCGGLYYGIRAKNAGHTGALAAIIANAIVLALNVMLIIFNIIAAVAAASSH